MAERPRMTAAQLADKLLHDAVRESVVEPVSDEQRDDAIRERHARPVHRRVRDVSEPIAHRDHLSACDERARHRPRAVVHRELRESPEHARTCIEHHLLDGGLVDDGDPTRAPRPDVTAGDDGRCVMTQ